MADRIVTDLSDVRLRSGMGAAITADFLQMNSFDICKWEDDFLSGVLTSSVYTTAATGSGSAVAAAVLAPSASANEWGNIRLTTGTTNDGVSSMSLPLQCQGDYNAVMAIRYRISAIANVKIEIGFRDSVASTTGTVNALDTPSFSASNGCCWVFDTDATVDTWAAEGVKATSAATGVTLATTAGGAAPVADTYQTMVVALMEDNAYFDRYSADGRKQGATIMLTDCNTGSVNLAPAVFVQTRNTTSKNLDVDFFKMWQLRRS
jgi:hypothetical protein